VCDEGSEADSEENGPLWEGNILRLVCEENFGDDKCRMNSCAENEDEEKIKHRDLPFKRMKESSIKSIEEEYNENVGSNLGFRRIGDSLPRSYSLPRNSGGVAERQLVEDDRVHFRHKLNIVRQRG
jgi:hypothetical protein